VRRGADVGQAEGVSRESVGLRGVPEDPGLDPRGVEEEEGVPGLGLALLRDGRREGLRGLRPESSRNWPASSILAHSAFSSASGSPCRWTPRMASIALSTVHCSGIAAPAVCLRTACRYSRSIEPACSMSSLSLRGAPGALRARSAQ